MIVGETVLDFNCLGNSSLSSILEVFASSCLLLSGEDRTDWSILGLETQAGENVLGTSLTTSCSHSSAIEAVVLSSLFVRSSSGVSSSKSIASRTMTSEESGSFEFSSDVVSSSLGGSGLEYPCDGGKYQDQQRSDIDMLTMTIAENQSKCNPKLSFRNYQKMRSYPSIPISN